MSKLQEYLESHYAYVYIDGTFATHTISISRGETMNRFIGTNRDSDSLEAREVRSRAEKDNSIRLLSEILVAKEVCDG